MKRNFKIEKNKIIFHFLKKKFERRLQEAIHDTITECKEIAAVDMKRVARIHRNEVDDLNQR
jgi:hypothetical protein